MYRSLPPDFCDRQTARCRVSPWTFRDLALIVGQWVLLESEGNLHDQIYCRAWPARFDCRNDILVDRYVTRQGEAGDEGAWVPEEARYNLKILMPSIPKAQRVEVRVSVIRDNSLPKSEETAYEEATELMKRNIVHRVLENLVLGMGFSVKNIDSGLLIKVMSASPCEGPFLVAKGTSITIMDKEQEVSTPLEGSSSAQKNAMDIAQSFKIIPGLEGSIMALLDVVSYPLLYPGLIARLNIECPKGVLLHGPPGVGKTLLVSTVAQICRARMITIHGPEIFGPYVGESEEKLRRKFDQASRLALADPLRPVVIFIDELDALTPHRTDAQAHESRVVAQLLTLMDGVASRGRVVVIAATNRPNSIDPALRRPGRFDREIRMDVPGVSNRRDIIQSLIKDVPHTLKEKELDELARMTNGFVGADLEALCRESALGAVHRKLALDSTAIDSSRSSSSSTESVSVAYADFERAFRTSAPSLQRGYGVVVEPVRWSDIGGLDSVKIQLRQAVEWPVQHEKTFSRLGLKAPRGILLYGPPGCSKTTLVKAIATSSGASFLSVNGAALYSSFVGDSEKTIRETFRQARLSAPSIIFFDEIDTIVGKRNFSSGGGQGGDSVQERVLSTMLNEMDGVENAAGVLIVAATNRVDLIDKALLRPGRFDRVVYVPPPDLVARRQILSIYTRDIPVADDVDLDHIAQATDLFTGADLQNLCREAALIALRTRILSATAASTGATLAEQNAPPESLVTADDFRHSMASAKPSLTSAMLLEYSGTGRHAF